MRLFRLELKRVIKTRTTWILLAAALLLSVLMAWLPVTFETRNVVEDGVEKELTGFDAIRVKRQAQAGIAGVITEAQLKAAAETAVRVLREYEKNTCTSCLRRCMWKNPSCRPIAFQSTGGICGCGNRYGPGNCCHGPGLAGSFL